MDCEARGKIWTSEGMDLLRFAGSACGSNGQLQRGDTHKFGSVDRHGLWSILFVVVDVWSLGMQSNGGMKLFLTPFIWGHNNVELIDENSDSVELESMTRLEQCGSLDEAVIGCLFSTLFRRFRISLIRWSSDAHDLLLLPVILACKGYFIRLKAIHSRMIWKTKKTWTKRRGVVTQETVFLFFFNGETLS